MTAQRSRGIDGESPSEAVRSRIHGTIPESRRSELRRQDGGSATLLHMNERLADYVDRQGGVARLRHHEMPAFPWPGTDNPMLTYLVHRAEEIATTDGRPAATIWLAVHAWFEGASEALADSSLRPPPL